MKDHKNVLTKLINEYWEGDLPETKDREIVLSIKTDLINDIVGVRRSGKTYLMFLTIKKLLKRINKQATIYINFENRRLLPLIPEYFNDLIEFIYSERLLEKYKRIYLFLDEVQRITGWEKYVRSIYDEFKGKLKIFVSGSSRELLSKEYAKLLTGRHLTTTVFPLSFKEFLNFKGFDYQKFLTEKDRAILKKYLREYLKFGGFPEVVLNEEKEKMLNQLFSDILARDILSRVGEEQIIEEFGYYLASNVGNLLSFNRMANYFKSRGIKISVLTLQTYFWHMKNAFLFFDNLIFSYKVKDQLQYPRKIYCIDSGIANFVGFKFSPDMGRIYENTIAVELLRRGNKTFYWRSRTGYEVDFVIKRGLKINQLIQACYDITDLDTKKREIRGLLKASKELNCNDLLVITEDYEAKEKIKGKKIKFLPLWKWLL